MSSPWRKAVKTRNSEPGLEGYLGVFFTTHLERRSSNGHQYTIQVHLVHSPLLPLIHLTACESALGVPFAYGTSIAYRRAECPAFRCTFDCTLALPAGYLSVAAGTPHDALSPRPPCPLQWP